MGKLVTKKNSSESTLTLGVGAIAHTAPSPYESATARNRGNVQIIVRKDHRMRLSFLREQLVRSSEKLVLMDTKRALLVGFAARCDA